MAYSQDQNPSVVLPLSELWHQSDQNGQNVPLFPLSCCPPMHLYHSWQNYKTHTDYAVKDVSLSYSSPFHLPFLLNFSDHNSQNV